ncbi:hypothetical protein BDV12DRAFT_210087 [Aspergillus spectabilis]
MKLLLWLLPLLPSTTARSSSFHPQHRPDITFAITIPQPPTDNPSSILFRIQAPASIEWIALAQGTHMADANMFLVYASASSATNVTVSPRTASGHVPPRYNPDARVVLLSGSGIKGVSVEGEGKVNEEGVTTADIECFTCLRGYGGGMDPDGKDTRWLWAFKEGDKDGDGGLRSDDLTARIGFHDLFGRAVVDISRARTDPSSNDLFSDPDFSAVRPVDSDDGDTASGGTGNNLAITHGILMAISFLILFPLFALSVPLGYPVTKIHAPLQGLSLAITLLGAILGLNLWTSAGRPTHAHPILGLTVISTLVLIQPVLGYLQHRHFVRGGGKSIFGYAHRWLGRVGILLGVVNGLVGFWWMGAVDKESGWHTAFVWYGVVAGVLGVGFVGVRGWVNLSINRKRKGVEADIRGRVVGGYRDLDEDGEDGEDENEDLNNGAR